MGMFFFQFFSWIFFFNLANLESRVLCTAFALSHLPRSRTKTQCSHPHFMTQLSLTNKILFLLDREVLGLYK